MNYSRSYELRLSGPPIDAKNLQELLRDLLALSDWQIEVSGLTQVLDELEAPTHSGGIELSIEGRIRALRSALVVETNRLRSTADMGK